MLRLMEANGIILQSYLLGKVFYRVNAKELRCLS